MTSKSVAGTDPGAAPGSGPGAAATPDLRQESLDDVFKALGDPSRRRLLDRLNNANGQNLNELCAGMGMARQSVTKHLAILEAANLIVVTRQGRERLHYLNPAPINDVSDRWINHYHRNRVHARADLKAALELPVTLQAFVYQTYIKTTPEQLWLGLTSAEFTRRYWDNEFTTTWQVGSQMTWHHHGVTIADPAQVVTEADPYRRLAYTWHTFTPELLSSFGIADDVQAKLATEPRTTVTFDIEDLGNIVKLTVRHDGFDPNGIAVTMVSQGWPHILSDLKTLLETGDTLTPSS